MFSLRTVKARKLLLSWQAVSAVLLGRASPHTRKLASETHPDGVVFSRTWGEGLGVGSGIHWTSASVRLKDSNKRSRSTELAG